MGLAPAAAVTDGFACWRLASNAHADRRKQWRTRDQYLRIRLTDPGDGGRDIVVRFLRLRDQVVELRRTRSLATNRLKATRLRSSP